jgi:hypothetical protein
MELKTVKVKSDNPAHKQGFFEVNESDFDAETMEKFDEPKSSGGSKMTKADLQDALDEKGVEYPAHATKDELQKLLDGAQ